jgi:hypothetical protein
MDYLPGWAPESKVAKEAEGVRLRAGDRDSEETPDGVGVGLWEYHALLQ